mmetsp:Transcript_43191/g.82386  ORF Transcript_43191/g.82386 Transcript_43191/m.82386 type:complete len:243 (-) Transcript_43191:401-1129(-)
MKDGSEDILRDDGRAENQIRALVCERGLLNRADGSARWTQDATTVIAAVYGPRAIPGYKESAEKAKVEVTFKPCSDLPGVADKEHEHIIQNTLEAVILTSLHPRTGISIILQVVNDDGSLLACSINAACAALVDAGVAMKGLVTSISMALLSDGVLLLDPTVSEQLEAQALMTLAFTSSKPLPGKLRNAEPDPVITSITSGTLPVEEYFRCVDLGRTASERIAAFFQLSLEKYQRGWQMFSK